ncbi:unnamed protein product [Psylliodes chrysocephalus]|uniref:C2H2-type domain-containing protein n=1 Tax=Psylliodes chrysocephalus TaxID=3402493 RepID=A0A9P0CNF4_9CUCU|nr:unnamed protein product [Psylliodes chrysocephala]
MKSEVEHEENEEFQQYYERNMLTCFGCNFETENIDELDEHILINHDGDETEPVEQKYQIVADEEEEEVSAKNSKYMNKQVKTTTRVDIPNRKIPRGKIIIRPRETKFEICNDTKFSVDDDDDLDPSPPKRAKRTPAEEMKCHLCPFITQKKSVLSTHMLNHSDVIPPVYFKCSQCPYQTKRKNDMPKHMLGHCSNVSIMDIFWTSFGLLNRYIHWITENGCPVDIHMKFMDIQDIIWTKYGRPMDVVCCMGYSM